MFEKYANLHLLAKSVKALYASGEQVLAKCVKQPFVEAKPSLVEALDGSNYKPFPGCSNSMRKMIEKAKPIHPATMAKIRYIVPMSL